MQYTVSPPTYINVVSLEEAKANLRLTHSLQDELVQGMIHTAVTMAENYTGRYIHNRAVAITCEQFVQDLELRETPVAGNVSIQYRDGNDVLVALDPTLYSVTKSATGEQVIHYHNVGSLPTLYTRTDAVTISYAVGYSSSTVPAPYKTFVNLMVGKLYDNPADTALKYRSFAHSLLFPYKKHA